MNYFSGGFIQIPRSELIDSSMFGRTNEAVLLYWLWNLAAYQPKRVLQGTKLIELMPGQLSVTFAELEEVTGLSRQQTRTAASTLAKLGKINHNSNHKFQMITICNYKVNEDSTPSTNHNSNHTATTTQPQLLENNHNSNHKFCEPIYEYDEAISDLDTAHNHNMSQALIRKEGKKENKPNIQSGGNYPASARPGKPDHHLGRGVNLATEALKAAEQEKFDSIVGGMSDPQLRDKFVATIKEHFDPAFTDTRPNKTKSKGFSFLELNEEAGKLLSENDWDWMIRFGKWLQERKVICGGIPLKVSQINFYKGIFDLGKPPGHATEMAQMYAIRRGK